MNVELRYYFGDKIVRVNSDQPMQNVIDEVKFILEKGVF